MAGKFFIPEGLRANSSQQRSYGQLRGLSGVEEREAPGGRRRHKIQCGDSGFAGMTAVGERYSNRRDTQPLLLNPY
jgi:hypothetical protein